MPHSSGHFETLVLVRGIGYCVGLLVVLVRAYRWARGIKADAPKEAEKITEKPRKNVWVAYLLLCTGGGFFGAHHHYLGNYTCGMLYSWSWGLCGCGVLYDFFTLWYQVRRINRVNELTGNVDASATAMVTKVLCNWFPKIVLLFGVVSVVLILYVPATLDRIGVIDLYALKGGTDRNPFEILEIPRYASFDQAKKSFRALSLKYHPDRNPDCTDCAAKMADLNAAFAVIKKKEGNPEYSTENEASRFFDIEGLSEDWVLTTTDLLNRFQAYQETSGIKTKKKNGKKKKNKANKHEEGFFHNYINDMFSNEEL